MKRKKSRSTPKMARKLKPAGYSVDALSRITGADPKTINKAIHRAQIKPSGTRGGFPVYSDLAAIQAAITSKPDKTLREDKLAEEIRKLRLANDAKEGKLIPRDLVNRTIQSTTGEMIRLLSQKLENEFPALCVGLDIPGIRTKGKQLLDLIMAEWRKLVEAWPE